MAYIPKNETPKAPSRAEGKKPRSTAALSRLCICMAVVTVIACGFGIYSLATSAHRYSVLDSSTTKAVVATRDIHPGQQIEAGDLAVAELPSAMVPGSAANEASAVVGSTALSSIPKNAIVDKSNLSGEASDTLAGRIAEGKLALAVSVTQQTGVAGLVRQGDRVSLYGDIGADAERLAENARVLAVDSNLDASSPEYTALTVELAPKEAERVAQALQSGQVAFAVEPAKAGDAKASE